MIQAWPSDVDTAEQTRRLVDLFLVSVLLDAGAGTKWQYKSKDNGRVYRRSEGLAVASLDMFKEGLFSSNPEQKEQVDGGSLFLFIPWASFQFFFLPTIIILLCRLLFLTDNTRASYRFSIEGINC